MNNVDPTGENTYTVDSLGVVFLEVNDKPNTLIGVGIDGKEKSLALDANQSEMLEGLLATQEYGSTEGFKNTATSSTISKKSALALFKALADYSKVEWSLSYSNVFTLGTFHHEEYSPSLHNRELKWIVHSHPRIDGTEGASYRLNHLGNYDSGDMSNVINNYNTWIKEGNNPYLFPKHYIYHRYTSIVYYYSPFIQSETVPSGIKSIGSWGTLIKQ